MQRFLANTLNNETTIKLIVVKKYKDDNYGSYTITTIYNPLNNKNEFKGI